MFKMGKLESRHLEELIKERMNSEVQEWMDINMMKYLLDQPFSAAIYYKDVLMVVGGVIGYWENRASIWTVFSEKSKDNFLPVFRGIKTYLNYQPFRRVELSVPVDFKLGQRRAEMLGFVKECDCAKAFLPDGRDCALYSFVKEGE